MSKGWGLVFKRKAKVEIEEKRLSKQDRNSEAGEIDKGKGNQEEELKEGEVGQKKSPDSSEKKSKRGKFM